MSGPLFKARRRGGFTLIEVVVSAALLAVIMIIMWSSFANTYRTRDAAIVRFDSIRAAQSALRRMQREISMAFVSKIGEVPTNEDGEVTYQTAFIGRDDRMDFTSFAHMRTMAGEIASEQAEVSYYLASVRGRDGRLHQNLVRREQAPIDGEMEEGGYIYTLLEDVQDLRFEYWDPDTEIAGDAWVPDWDTTDTGTTQLPSRVRFTVEVMDPICQLAQSAADRRACQIRRDNLVFTAQADIQLTLPIGFATNIVDADTLRAQAEAEAQGRTIEEVLAEESDEPDPNAFEDRVDQVGRGGNRGGGRR